LVYRILSCKKHQLSIRWHEIEGAERKGGLPVGCQEVLQGVKCESYSNNSNGGGEGLAKSVSQTGVGRRAGGGCIRDNTSSVPPVSRCCPGRPRRRHGGGGGTFVLSCSLLAVCWAPCGLRAQPERPSLLANRQTGQPQRCVRPLSLSLSSPLQAPQFLRLRMYSASA
jgi:hypothetical protein